MMTLREEVAQILPDAIEMRRYLHSHPELSGEEFQTREYICNKLRSERGNADYSDFGRSKFQAFANVCKIKYFVAVNRFAYFIRR